MAMACVGTRRIETGAARARRPARAAYPGVAQPGEREEARPVPRRFVPRLAAGFGDEADEGLRRFDTVVEGGWIVEAIAVVFTVAVAGFTLMASAATFFG